VSTPGGAIAETRVVGRAIRTPRSAAVAGIAFSVLFTLALVLVRTAVPTDPADAGRWLSDSSRRDAVLLALGVVPFAGIAFLWFIGVVRDRVGDAEDRFFATVFLGSGLLFVGMLFVAAAVAAGLVASAGKDGDTLLSSSAWTVGRRTSYELLNVYAMRMAAVFTLAASTILMRTGLAPRWLVAAGYTVAVLLLVATGFFAWIELLFPAWVLALSLYVLIAGFRRGRAAGSGAPPAPASAS
jgi:preprotein translocase subunit Sec61beta